MEQINEADYTERLKTRLYYAEKSLEKMSLETNCKLISIERKVEELEAVVECLCEDFDSSKECYNVEKRKLMLSKVLLTLKKALDDELQAFKKFVNNGLDIAED